MVSLETSKAIAMQEILIISGKGGTGKTSVTAAFAHLAAGAVICDLDVDAPDLHLILDPAIKSSHDFISGNLARVAPDKCDGCGKCAELCRFQAITLKDAKAVVDEFNCEGCKVCVTFCPTRAIDFPDNFCGRWYISDSRFGPMVHAQLFPGEENSGRLVALLRQEAKKLAESNQAEIILSDGPPGIGCPVISSLSGSSLAVIVTEPTQSAIHDLERVARLCSHFSVPACVLVNKADLNQPLAEDIERRAGQQGLVSIGRLPFDQIFVQAVVAGKAVTEIGDDRSASALRKAWQKIESILNNGKTQPKGETKK